jgi:hypothetical protein
LSNADGEDGKEFEGGIIVAEFVKITQWDGFFLQLACVFEVMTTCLKASLSTVTLTPLLSNVWVWHGSWNKNLMKAEISLIA